LNQESTGFYMTFVTFFEKSLPDLPGRLF